MWHQTGINAFAANYSFFTKPRLISPRTPDNFPPTFPLHERQHVVSPFIFPSFLFVSDDESDPEASELDLGTKIKTPKDVMLEELSLLNNKGSKMFKMRQQRVEKFIVTNENNVRAIESKGLCT